MSVLDNKREWKHTLLTDDEVDLINHYATIQAILDDCEHYRLQEDEKPVTQIRHYKAEA